MKALLYKDWCIMRSQVVMPLMMLWVIGISIFFKNDLGSAMGVTLVCSMVPYLTIASDEGCMYLRLAFSQPISRKAYVWSKYLINLLLIGGLAAFLLIGRLTGLLIKEAQASTLGFLLSLAIPTVVTALLLPAVFRFGVGKTRLLYMALILGVTAGFSSGKAFSQWITGVAAALNRLSPAVLALGGVVLLAMLMAGSIVLSIAIVQKKDY